MSDMEYLYDLPRFADSGAPAVKPGFDRIRALLDGLDHPEREYRIVLVAGTNGKGSVASFTAAICTALGYRTGLHTSPHLFGIGERMRVNGKPATGAALENLAASMRDLVMDVKPSFFEATLAMSLAWLRGEEVDLAIVEVGLGGRLDATNILDADVSVITNIGLDHTDLLGETVEAIAAEKAGIIKEGKPVVIGPVLASARSVIENIARARNAPVVQAASWIGPRTIQTPVGRYTNIELGLAGEHQRTNFATALRTAELIKATSSLTDDLSAGKSGKEGAVRGSVREGAPLDMTCVRTGALHVRKLSGLRARLEVISTDPLIVVDVAHNPEGVAASLEGFLAMEGQESTSSVAIVGLLGDKDAQGVGAALARQNVPVICVSTYGGRGRDADGLAQAFRSAGCEVLLAVESVAEAMKSARKTGKSILIVGSHTTAAEAISAST